MKHDDVARVLGSYRLRFGTEKVLQDSIERVFDAERIPFVRECRTSTGPIDFLVEGSIGVECKIDGGPSAVLEQLLRYAGEPNIESLILITSRSTHRFTETALLGKPFTVIWAAGNL